mgnify:CR=1 FL=1
MLTPKKMEKNLFVMRPYFIPSFARTNENSPIWLKRTAMLIVTFEGSFKAIPVISVAVNLITRIITVRTNMVTIL